MRKMIKKKQIRKAAATHIKNTMKDIFNYNPKKWYDLVKKLSGKQISNIDFQLDKHSIKTANDLRKHLAKIV